MTKPRLDISMPDFPPIIFYPLNSGSQSSQPQTPLRRCSRITSFSTASDRWRIVTGGVSGLNPHDSIVPRSREDSLNLTFPGSRTTDSSNPPTQAFNGLLPSQSLPSRTSRRPMEPGNTSPHAHEAADEIPRRKLVFRNYLKEPQTCRNSNQQILKLLRKGVKLPPAKPGWIYILVSPNAPNHVKIGKTRRTPEIRKSEWRKCKIPLVEVSIGSQHGDAFFQYSLVESFIKAELGNQRKTLDCMACSELHEEWYEINVDDAIRIICRWKCWMVTQRPFNRNGRLTSYWQRKVDRLPLTLDMVNWDEWTQRSRWALIQDLAFYFGWYPASHVVPRCARKDFHFVVTGIIIGMGVWIWFGSIGLCCTMAALLILKYGIGQNSN